MGLELLKIVMASVTNVYLSKGTLLRSMLLLLLFVVVVFPNVSVCLSACFALPEILHNIPKQSLQKGTSTKILKPGKEI